MSSFPAPAKINLHLKVTRTLANGYHELDTSFAYVDVADRLTITPAEQLQVSCSDPSLSGDNNLVYKVLDALRRKHGVAAGLAVHIEKLLPAQAGLGGGSSDAATALLVANEHWQLSLSTEELIEFAVPFGADIPCFLFGQASLATGIGDRLTVYPEALPQQWLLLAHPGTGLSTPEVFHCYDRRHQAATLTRDSGADTIRGHSGTVAGGELLGSNDLEACACELSTEVDTLLREMRSVSERAWMSGSGSTCVAMFAERQQAETAADLLRQRQLADWIHVGKLMKMHPLRSINIGA